MNQIGSTVGSLASSPSVSYLDKINKKLLLFFVSHHSHPGSNSTRKGVNLYPGLDAVYELSTAVVHKNLELALVEPRFVVQTFRGEGKRYSLELPANTTY